MIPKLPMLGRRQLRLAAVGALARANLTVGGATVEIQSPGDWNVPPERLPVVIVRTGTERKASIVRGPPEFTTNCTLEVKAMIEGPTGEDAQDAIEALWFDVEAALLTNYSLVGMLQQFAAIDSALEIKADGARHLAGIAGAFHCEFFESWSDHIADAPQPPVAPPAPPAPPWPNDPPAPVPLDGMRSSVDLTNVVDPTGTYPNPPFPDAVMPAPRTRGPDGRDEGALDTDWTKGG